MFPNDTTNSERSTEKMVTARTALSSMRLSRSKPDEEYKKKTPYADETPIHRLAERANFTTAYNRPKMSLAMVMPALAFISIIIAILLFLISIINGMHDQGEDHDSDVAERLYQAIRIANEEEHQNGTFVSLKYPNCEKGLRTGCWKKVELEESDSTNMHGNYDLYVRNVYAYVKPEPNVICPPSIFVGEKAPEPICTSNHG
ncbi:unnamed protein product [Cylicocyclus nassatus]|uniref:Uncharacterized protein n=1 Tax=Cylicocyclus nassatus TaxID=53992 RepID=A0AA36DQS3_CYLNA|nr:unnamed protein product [Cylicocyclus nassatus]